MAEASSSTPRGRRPGAPDTRGTILARARSLFATSGFAGTTVRAVARAAGVDPALVHHYFGTKEDLFLAALEVPVDPRAVLAEAAVGDLDEAATRLLRAFLLVWDDPRLQPRLVAFVRGALDPQAPALIRDGVLPVLIQPIGVALGLDEPERRMTLVASQVLGLIVLRYVLEVPPLAALSADEVVAIYAPTLQRYLTMPLP